MELPVQFAKRLPDGIRGLSSLVGFDGLVVGWNVGYDLAGLSLAHPAIQVVDLATDCVAPLLTIGVPWTAAADQRQGGATQTATDHLPPIKPEPQTCKQGGVSRCSRGRVVGRFFVAEVHGCGV